LLGFLAALMVIVAAGVWASVWAWRMRMAAAHLLALAVTTWGVVLMANQVLQRTGYAATGAAWRCPEPVPSFATRERGGRIERPDGTILRYRDLGSGNVRLIAADAMVLTDFLRPLSQQLGLALYDPRHRGASRAASDTAGVGLDTDVDDLAAVRQNFAVENVAVLGWAYSAPTAALFAALRPDIVTRVILIAPLPPRRASYQLDWTRGAGQDTLGLELLRILRVRGEDLADTAAYCRRYWDIAVLHPWMGDAAALRRRTWDPCGFENEQPERREASFERMFDALGAWDPIPIEGAEEWIESFPNARLLRIEGAGHMPWLEQPGMVLGAIETFLGGAWPEGAVGR
jgi:proline iminopeptidase